jgi:nicotinamidase/pyrazinamidase
VYDRATALVVVDVQNDFADPAGSLYVWGAGEIFPVLNRELVRASAAEATIAYTQDWHPEVTPHFRTWPMHCVRGTWGARFHPSLLRVQGATVILKGTRGEDGYSGFSYVDPASGRTGKTALENVLRRRGVARVVVAGLATDYCVKHTALDALAARFEVMVLDDAVRAVDLKPGDGMRAIDEIARRGGEIVSSAGFHRLPHELGAS